MKSKKLLKFLKDIVYLQTTPGNKNQQKNALRMIQEHLPQFFCAKYFSKNNYPSAFFYPKNSTSIDIILSAHIDVVPAKEGLFRLIRKGDKLFGRGVFDMKGPLVALVESLNLYYHDSKGLTIGLLVTSDEEKGGFKGTNFFLDNYKSFRPKLAIVADGGNNFDIVIEEKGVLKLEILYSGRSAHGARPWEGVNAANNLVKALERVIKKYPDSDSDKWNTTAALTSFDIELGAANVVPHFAKARLNFRYIAKDSLELIIKSIKRLDKNIDIKVIAHGKAMKVSPKLFPVKLFKTITETHVGHSVSFVKYSSTCDARFFVEKNIPTIITRPSGGAAHGDNEWISIDSLDAFVGILLNFFRGINKKLKH